MNYVSYKVLADAMQDFHGRRLQNRELEERRMQRALEAERLQREHQMRMMEGSLRLRAHRQGLSESGEAAADRDLERQVAPIRAEQQNYDEQRAVVEQRLNQAMKRRSELEGQIADQRRLNWQMNPANPANQHAAALAAKAGKVEAPTARVTEESGNTKVAYDVPVADMEKSLRSRMYRSPYADDIADFDKRIAEQESEIAGGDERTGFLGVGKSRRGVIAQAKAQRLQLKAMELQDMLERGIISQEEADRRAEALMRL